jgi:uncharacterized protein
MKLQPDATSGPTITGYGPGWVAVNGEQVTTSVVIPSNGVRFGWDCTSFDALTERHFQLLADLDCELVVFGSGEKIRFPQPVWLQTLYARRIGVETMDTQAACRTYNFLAAEGRKVIAALIL